MLYVICQKSAKNAQINFPQPNVMYSNCLFRPNSSPKHKTLHLFLYMTQKSNKPSHLRILFTLSEK